jgi:hypothetical protein
MTQVWIPIVVGGLVVTVLVLARWRARVARADLGTVSVHWLTEQRANAQPYSER